MIKSSANDSGTWRGADYRDVRLRDYPLLLAQLGRREQLTELVCSLSFLDEKLRRFGLDSVIDDVDNCVRLGMSKEIDALRALADALRLARVGLNEDASQLAAQLSGRLMNIAAPPLHNLIREARASAARSNLISKTAALAQGHRPGLDALAFDTKFEDLAVSPDLSFIVTSADDERVSVWSLPLRADSRLLTFKVPHLTSMALSAKGDFILTGNQSGELQKWDRKTGFCEASVETGGEYVKEIRPAGSSLVAAILRQGDICVVDLQSFNLIRLFPANVPACLCGISEHHLLVGTTDGFIDQFDPQTGMRTSVLGWHGPFKEQRMTELELFMRSMTMNQMYVTTGVDEIQPFLNLDSVVDNIGATEAQKRQFVDKMREDPLKDAVNCLSFDAGGKALALSCAGETEMALLDLDLNRVLRRFRTNFSQAMRCCALSTAADLAVSGSYDHTIRLWRLGTGEYLGTLVGATGSPVAIHFLSGTSALVAAFDDGQLKIWHDPETMTCDADGSAHSAIGAISPLDGFAYVIANSAISCWSPKTQTQLARRLLPILRPVNLITPDARRAISFDEDNILVFDVNTAWPLRTLALEPTTVGPQKAIVPAKIGQAVISSDLERIVTFRYGNFTLSVVGNHSLLELRDARGKLSRLLDGRAGWIDELRMSPDGQSLVTIGRKTLGVDQQSTKNASAQELRLWNLTSGECIWNIEDPGLCTAAFGDEGRQLWFVAGRHLRRCSVSPEAQPETVVTLSSSWKSFQIEGSLVVGFAGKTIEVWDLTIAARVSFLTLDADVTAARIVDNSLIVGDRQGNLHFFASELLEKTRFPAANIHAETSYLQKLDTAARLNSQGDGSGALELWIELARLSDAGPELRIALAKQLKRLGYSRESQSIGLAIALDAGIDYNLRLSAIEGLPVPEWLLLVNTLALQCDDLTLVDPSSPARKLFLGLLERIIDKGSDELALATADTSIPSLGRAVVASALGRQDPQRAIEILREIASNGTTSARIVALEGLRHLTPLADWIDTATISIEHGNMNDDGRWAICRMLLLELNADFAVFFAEKGRLYWHELGLLNSYVEVNNRAMVLASAELRVDALAILDIAIRNFPSDVRLHLNRAGILMREKKWADVIDEANRCLAIEPQTEKALNYRAYARIEIEEFEFALEDCNQALAMKPGDFANLRNRSACFRALGRVEEADADSVAADRARELEGDEAESQLEASDRPSRYDVRREELTDALRIKAAGFLRLIRLADRASTFLSRIASDTTVLNQFRGVAIEGLYNIRAVPALSQLIHDSELDVELKIKAAGSLAKLENTDRTGFFGRRRTNDARTFLDKIVTGPNVDLGLRYLAAHELTDILGTDELEELARSLPDLDSVRESGPQGIGVATVLLKSIAQRGEFDRLEALASSRKEKGWLRELASQCIGVFRSRDLAVKLSELHLAENPKDEPLIRSINHALNTYRTANDQPTFSPDPAIEEGFRAFLTAETVDVVISLSERYFFFGYEDFIFHVERYTSYYPPKSGADLLKRKIEALKNLPRNFEQEAFREFAQCDSPEQMRAAADKFPILTTPQFQAKIESSVEQSVAIADQPSFRTRMQWLRALPRDKWQEAIQAFINARRKEDLHELLEHYPFIRSDKFRDMVKRAQVVGAPLGHVQSRLEWLEQQGRALSDVLYGEAIDALQGGTPDAALEKLEKLRVVDPESRSDLLAGAAYLESKKYDKAIEYFTRAVEHNPSALGYEGRGKARFILNRSIEAVEDFTCALAIDPHSSKALLGRGLAFSKLENYLAASQDLERALQLQPTDELIAFPLAVAYLKLEEPERATHLINDFAHWSEDFRGPTEDLLRAIQLLNGEEVRSPGSIALESLYSSGTTEEQIAHALQQNPIFWDSGFQEAALQHIQSIDDEQVRSKLEINFGLVLEIVRNPGQLAYNAFVAADDQEAMRRAVSEHELLRTPEFIGQLRELSPRGDEQLLQRLSRQWDLYRLIS